MPVYRTKAVVIKRRNQGEADRVLTLFSYDKGRISAIAKGARKQKSKYGGSVELFTECDFILNSGKTFEIVSEAFPLRHFLSEETDLTLISEAHFFAELTIKVIVEEHPVPAIYDALAFCLENLNSLNPLLLKVYYISQILKVLGAYPELGVCLACQEKPTGDIWFSHTAGGIFCDSCKPVAESLARADRDTVKLWRFILDATPEQLARIKVSNVQSNTLAETVETFLKSTTGREYLALDTLKLTN